MKIEYDKPADILTITIREAQVMKSAEVRFGVGVDYDADGQVFRFKITNASEHIENVSQWKTNPQAILTQAMDRLAAAVSYSGNADDTN